MSSTIIDKLQQRAWNWLAQATFHADARFRDSVRFLGDVSFEGATGPFVYRGTAEDYDKELADFTRDGDYHDLDLSAIVPSGAKAIVARLRVEADAAGKHILCGYPGTSLPYESCVVRTQVAGIPMDGTAIIPCSTARVIGYACSDESGFTWTSIYLCVIGWLL